MSFVSSRLMLLSLLASVSVVAFVPSAAFAQDAGTDKAKVEKPKRTQAEQDEETYRQLNLFGDVFEQVRAKYVDEVEDKVLIENAINGMLTALDPHSNYLNEDGLKDMQVQTRGEFGGLGIEVTQENGMVKVVTPIDDTPAFRAGMKSGDLITHLDGKPLVGLNLNEAVDQLRGKVGSKITLTVRREGEPKPLKISLVRDTIKIQSVRHRIEGDVGYIRITSFSDSTTDSLKKAILDIEKKLGKKLRGFVIDLRNNPGGLLDQAIGVSDAFLDKGEIVSTRGRNDRDTRRDNASSGDLTEGAPIVIIINGGTASAAEIVSGALQDHRRAIILGTQSFGKGSVQTVMPINGTAAMKLTTARYYTPSGRSIQAKGIMPDIIVEQAKIEEEKDTGDRIKESDLKGALANPDGSDDKDMSTTPSMSSPTPSDDDSNADDVMGVSKKKETPEELAKKDYQLQRALDLVRGLSLYHDGQVPPGKLVAVTEQPSSPSPSNVDTNKPATDQKDDKNKESKPDTQKKSDAPKKDVDQSKDVKKKDQDKE